MIGLRWYRGLCCGVILFSAARAQAQPVQTAAQAPAAAVSWSQLPPDCPVPASRNGDVQVVACGGSGSFVFSRPGVSYQADCVPLDSGTATPALFPTELVSPLPPGSPCTGGRCLGHTRGRPWVAILDWPSDHGWSVAATIREASDQRLGVELYDLTSAGTLSQETPVSDLAVLVELCAVAAADPDDRPLAVNMSFGRQWTKDDAAGSASDLGGLIRNVLQDLVTKEGILAVAAAGNDGELLFPAASPGVISAGALDLSYLQQTRGIKPSRQTPSDAAALMLGYGLYLSAGDGNPYWPAPPGSSYAAALLTGWLGGTVAGGGSLPDAAAGVAARWTPTLVRPALGAGAGAEGLALAYGGVPLPGSQLQGPRLLLDRAREAIPAAPGSRPGVTLTLTGAAPDLPPDSLLYADTRNDPQPGVNLCVPCRGNGDPGGVLDDPGTLLLDLSRSEGLPPQMDLVGVFLRVGKAAYRFDASCDPAVLAPIAAGALPQIALAGLDGLLQPGEQPSLVLVVNVGGTAYWHEVPIHLPG
jgi:hypothetical protein